MNDFLSSIEPNAWIQTFGGVLGALLAGGIAIILFRGQVNNDKKRDQLRELKNFLKSYYIIKKWLLVASQTAGEIYKAISDDDNEKLRLKVTVLKNETAALGYCIDVLNTINDDYIPMEIYNDFLEMKAYLELFKTTAIIQLGAYEEGFPLRTISMKELERKVDKISQYIRIFDDYGAKSEAEVKKIS
ncbi:hypothetical protein BSK54_10260 [Paenibacillus odorifer]|uniref:hypothetical protein n=1 Tax=Paenibacillus odorifer TaxID=189426 RepID=UPI00096F2759|nr:hypothetical protein [Paenibacillus odorifer]OME02633.1 hypothetical protein BSK54_10260 [Paenibacillus odorifer]